MNIDINRLPDFDVLIGGFPCQTFSIIGKRKGFKDNRGLIIYGIINILKMKNIKYFILENVNGLVNHDNGNTLKIIIAELKKLNYDIQYKVLNSSDYGVPQLRERVYIIGMKNGFFCKKFTFPEPVIMNSLKNYLIDTTNKYVDINNKTFQKYLNNKYNKGKFNLSELLQEDYLILDTRQSDLRIYKYKCPTLRTSRHGILYVKNKKLKKLSGFEGLLLQWFPYVIASKVLFCNISSNKILS